MATDNTIIVDGKTYTLGTFGFREDRQRRERLLELRRADRLRMTLQMRSFMPADLWAEEWQQAKQEARSMVVSDQDVATWMLGNEAKMYATWLMIEKAQPGSFPTWDDFEKVVDTMRTEPEPEPEPGQPATAESAAAKTEG